MHTSVDAYINSLPDWQSSLARDLAESIQKASPALVPVIKWSQPVFECNGPVCYLKGHKNHLTFGFWRGAALLKLDDRLETSGEKMAHMKLTEGMTLNQAKITQLVKAAVELNRSLGNPNAPGKSNKIEKGKKR